MDFKFIENTVSKKWIVSAPRRAGRPNIGKGSEPVCPFCVGVEVREKESYRIGGKVGDSKWNVIVIPNKYPFSQIHEIVIHSPDHHKNFEELPLNQSELIFKCYKDRFKEHQSKGKVIIFHNHGESGGESLPHPHTQIVILPDHIKVDVAPIDFNIEKEDFQETENFLIFAPLSSEWPDEVWIMPKKNTGYYSDITDLEIKDLAKSLYRLIQIFDLRHGHEFPLNFYISPFKSWYLRIVPRIKTLGGFEIATNISVNTQDPKETINFIKELFEYPNIEKIKNEHRADYKTAV